MKYKVGDYVEVLESCSFKSGKTGCIKSITKCWACGSAEKYLVKLTIAPGLYGDYIFSEQEIKLIEGINDIKY